MAVEEEPVPGLVVGSPIVPGSSIENSPDYVLPEEEPSVSTASVVATEHAGKKRSRNQGKKKKKNNGQMVANFF